ncbi:hypothetical protein Tco_0590232 [Tanacetum coccineum]
MLLPLYYVSTKYFFSPTTSNDITGEQFPPINSQIGTQDLGTNQGYYDQGTVVESGNNDCNKPDSDNDNCANEDGSKKGDEHNKGEKEKSCEGKNRGVWNMNFAEIVNANRIDNKLMEISTEISEDGNEVVVNDEMIELGCEKWKYTVCGFFVGGQVTYSEARYQLRRMWNKFGFLDLMKNNGGVFFCKFHDEHGMEEVVNNVGSKI